MCSPAQGATRDQPVNSLGKQGAARKVEVKKELISLWGEGIHAITSILP